MDRHTSFLFNLGWTGVEQALGPCVVSLCSSINVFSNSAIPSSLEYSPWNNTPIFSLKSSSVMGFTLLCKKTKTKTKKVLLCIQTKLNSCYIDVELAISCCIISYCMFNWTYKFDEDDGMESYLGTLKQAVYPLFLFSD